MFDFEKLDVYAKAKELNKEVLFFLRTQKNIDSYIRDQLRRASISIVNRFFIFRKYFDERGMTPLVDQRKYSLESSWLKTSMHSIRGISPINIAEGSGKFSKGEKRNYYTIARGSAYECVSLFDLIKEENTLSEEVFRNYYLKFETISKMLMGLIKSQAC